MVVAHARPSPASKHGSAVESASSEPTEGDSRGASRSENIRPRLIPLLELVRLILGEPALGHQVIQPLLHCLVLHLFGRLVHGSLDFGFVHSQYSGNTGRETLDWLATAGATALGQNGAARDAYGQCSNKQSNKKPMLFHW